MTKILLVDDDPLVLEALSVALEDNGYYVKTGTNGHIGTQLIERESFDLLITDIIMPEKEGLETLSEVKRTKPAMKVIVISGGGRISIMNYLDIAKKLGADGVLAKPFSSQELMYEVEKVLN